MQYNAIPCNTMQYNASLITADGAYHCPVGSIMAIFIYKASQSQRYFIKIIAKYKNMFLLF